MYGRVEMLTLFSQEFERHGQNTGTYEVHILHPFSRLNYIIIILITTCLFSMISLIAAIDGPAPRWV